MNVKIKPHIQALMVMRARGETTTEEIAMLLDTSERTVQKLLSGEKLDITAEEAAILSRYFSDRNIFRFTNAFMSPAAVIIPVGESTSNGIVDDEIAEIVESLGEIKKAHKTRSADIMESQITNLELLMNRLRAEKDRIK